MTTPFRPMRRSRQQLPVHECEAILASGTSGTLALLGDGDYPYAVPLSYVYTEGKIYFHSALAGHKIDAIKAHPKGSFCVIAADEVVPSEYTTYFKSVIAFGKISIVGSPAEKRQAATFLGEKYHPEASPDALNRELEKGLRHMHILRLDIEHLTGKEAIELTRRR